VQEHVAQAEDMIDEAATSGAPPPDDGDGILALAREVEGLRTQVARDHERAAAREHIIDRLHDENERLRAGERQLLLRPVLVDLQRLRHDLLRSSHRLPAGFGPEQAGELLRSYAHNLELTLERGGVRVLTPQCGTVFDAATQRAAGTVATTDPAHDGTVADLVDDGYYDVQADRVVQPATVRVHRFVAAAEPTG
jgi:molecular chaperone GrpE (heat shock protein)